MDKDMMTHCHLIRDNGAGGIENYHCWLPNKFAGHGRRLDIDGLGEGWLVAQCFNGLPTAVVLERGQDYKKTRRASDI